MKNLLENMLSAEKLINDIPIKKICEIAQIEYKKITDDFGLIYNDGQLEWINKPKNKEIIGYKFYVYFNFKFIRIGMYHGLDVSSYWIEEKRGTEWELGKALNWRTELERTTLFRLSKFKSNLKVQKVTKRSEKKGKKYASMADWEKQTKEKFKHLNKL